MEITATDKGIRTVEFIQDKTPNGFISNFHINDCIQQLDEYFKGQREVFSVKLDWHGTDFQKRVWNYLLTIPFGKTVAYMDIALALADEKSVRAVGIANGKNNIAIIVPCHRVIGSDGDLTGYAYGIWRKDWLLKHEKSYAGVEHQMELF